MIRMMEIMSHGNGMKITTHVHGNVIWLMPKKSKKKRKIQKKKLRFSKWLICIWQRRKSLPKAPTALMKKPMRRYVKCTLQMPRPSEASAKEDLLSRREKEKGRPKEKAKAKVKAKAKEKEKEKKKANANLRPKAEEDRLQEKTSDLSAGSSCEELAQVEQTAIFGIQNYVKIGRKEIAVKEMPAP